MARGGAKKVRSSSSKRRKRPGLFPRRSRIGKFRRRANDLRWIDDKGRLASEAALKGAYGAEQRYKDEQRYIREAIEAERIAAEIEREEIERRRPYAHPLQDMAERLDGVMSEHAWGWEVRFKETVGPEDIWGVMEDHEDFWEGDPKKLLISALWIKEDGEPLGWRTLASASPAKVAWVQAMAKIREQGRIYKSRVAGFAIAILS